MARQLDRDEVAAALEEAGSISAASRTLGVDRNRLARFVNADEELRALRHAPGTAGETVHIQGDDADIKLDTDDLGDLNGIIRGKGLKPRDWYVTALKVWETYHGQKRSTVYLRRRVAMSIITPARHVPAVVRPVPVTRPAGRPELIVVEGDHQAPYHDPGLDACTTAFWRDMQPVEGVFLGDTIDLPTISRHPDHPAASATPQACVDAGYGILRRRVEAAPNARVRKLKGNHDWRLEGELLARSERLYGIHAADDTIPALGLRRLLALDALGVELVEDTRGWEHAEVVLVPGGNGLVVRHGFVTGENTAKKTVAKLGRSAIVGHGHQKESFWRLVYPKRRLQWGFVAGTMSRNDGVFPHFAVNPDWHQGFVTVERWPDGAFVVEHAVYHDGALFWRDHRWEAPAHLLPGTASDPRRP